MYWLKSATYLLFRYWDQLSSPKLKNLFSPLEFAPNDHFILVSDGINKKLRNKKSELRQIIENNTNQEVKLRFK